MQKITYNVISKMITDLLQTKEPTSKFAKIKVSDFLNNYEKNQEEFFVNIKEKFTYLKELEIIDFKDIVHKVPEKKIRFEFFTTTNLFNWGYLKPVDWKNPIIQKDLNNLVDQKLDHQLIDCEKFCRKHKIIPSSLRNIFHKIFDDKISVEYISTFQINIQKINPLKLNNDHIKFKKLSKEESEKVIEIINKPNKIKEAIEHISNNSESRYDYDFERKETYFLCELNNQFNTNIKKDIKYLCDNLEYKLKFGKISFDPYLEFKIN